MAGDGGFERGARWAARVASLIVGAVFPLILVLAATNEDLPSPAGVVLLLLLVSVLAACAAAWRWERTGGIAVVAGGVVLAVVAWAGAPTSLGGGFGLVAAALYGLPFLLVGALFVAAGRADPDGRRLTS
jgi:hypothetical protein